MAYFFAPLLIDARCGRNSSSSPRPAGMSGDSLRGYPQPTASAPAQVWSGLDEGFLVDFHALGYTKTKGLTAAKTITEAGLWVWKAGRCSSGTLRLFLAVVLGVEAGVEPADAMEPAIADLLQQQLVPGEPQGAQVNPHASVDRSACRPARRSRD